MSAQLSEAQCPCDREKHIDPWCCAAGMCVREDEEMERAELGVDGNRGFALLGDDLQVGEAEFVEIKTTAAVGTSEWHHAAVSAATEAYRALKARLNDREFSYYLGTSHPNYC